MWPVDPTVASAPLVPQLSEADLATMYENLTIYDLRDVPPEAARALVRETLARWPLLQAIYDDASVDALVRRRTSENSLLLRLIQPNDPLNVTFWNEVVDELIVLGGAHAVATFRDRMRLEKLASIESWLTEIRLPAWLARNGIAIELEPLTVGKRRADFRAASVDTGDDFFVILPHELERHTVALTGTITVGGFDYATNIYFGGVDGSGSEPARCVHFNEIQVGPYRYQKALSCFAPNDAFGLDGGLIGFDFLRHFNWTFDYPHGRVVLTPNGA